MQSIIMRSSAIQIHSVVLPAHAADSVLCAAPQLRAGESPLQRAAGYSLHAALRRTYLCTCLSKRGCSPPKMCNKQHNRTYDRCSSQKLRMSKCVQQLIHAGTMCCGVTTLLPYNNGTPISVCSRRNGHTSQFMRSELRVVYQYTQR